MNKIFEIKNLKVHFPLKESLFKAKKVVHAVDDITFDVYTGEILGIVGESGCGKSSLARALVGLTPITSGSVTFDQGVELAGANARTWERLHKQVQFIFQDPVAALDPRMSIVEIIAEPLQTLYPTMKKAQIFEKVLAIMKLVGLSEHQLNRYPTEFSGGQCQRIGIARALILGPKVLICDESVSALDVSIKAQIINLLQDLQQKLNLTIIFISHDLGIVKHISDRILVMYLGNIMEIGDKHSIYNNPFHPYTKVLLNAIPIANPELERHKAQASILNGDLPSPISPPRGCVFNTRCPIVENDCKVARPELRQINYNKVSCIKA